MKRQVEMENSMLMTHRRFISGLEESIQLLDEELNEATDLYDVCTGEWCKTAEDLIDVLHKDVYGISEPRWLTEEDSQKIRNLRYRIRDLYAKYKSVTEH